MYFPTLPGGAADREDGPVTFACDGVAFPIELNAELASGWLLRVAESRDYVIDHLTYVLVGDHQLHAMNIERLGHDTLTDIITFDLSDGDRTIEGECYISLERVRDNAAELGEPPARELHRVLVHGLLHLCGMTDKSPPEAERMRGEEDRALLAWATLQ